MKANQRKGLTFDVTGSKGVLGARLPILTFVRCWHVKLVMKASKIVDRMEKVSDEQSCR